MALPYPWLVRARGLDLSGGIDRCQESLARAHPALDRNLNFAAVPTHLKLDLGNALAGENDAGLPAENF